MEACENKMLSRLYGKRFPQIRYPGRKNMENLLERFVQTEVKRKRSKSVRIEEKVCSTDFKEKCFQAYHIHFHKKFVCLRSGTTG